MRRNEATRTKMISFSWCLLLFFGWSVSDVSSARILAFLPFPMKSHHFVFQPIIKALCERNHQVTYVTAVPMKNQTNLIQIIVPNALPTFQEKIGFVSQFGHLPTPLISRFFYKMGEIVIDDPVMTHPGVQSIIHSTTDKYDLIFHEAFFGQEPVAALQHKFKVPSVAVQPLADAAWVNEMAGLTDNPSYMIDLKSHYTDRMNFVQKVYNTYQTWSTLAVSYYYTQTKMKKLMDKYFNYPGWEDRPSITQLVSDQALILINSHHSVGYSYPKAPHVKEIGGIHIQPNSPLPKDLETWLNNSPNGVIYFSLGTNVNMSEVAARSTPDAFTKVFEKLKQNVLWKWSGDDYPPVPRNVRISKWLPQQDVLAHKNVVMFITHGGLLSTMEAVTFGIPLIGIPFFADQVKNMKQVETTGYGILLTAANITETSVSWAINEILENPSYKKEALRRQSIFKDRTMTPLNESVYWIEYVLRYGNVLQPRSVHLSFVQMHCIDIFATIVVTLAITIWAIYYAYKFTSKIFRCKFENKSKLKSQ